MIWDTFFSICQPSFLKLITVTMLWKIVKKSTSVSNFSYPKSPQFTLLKCDTIKSNSRDIMKLIGEDIKCVNKNRVQNMLDFVWKISEEKRLLLFFQITCQLRLPAIVDFQNNCEKKIGLHYLRFIRSSNFEMRQTIVWIVKRTISLEFYSYTCYGKANAKLFEIYWVDGGKPCTNDRGPTVLPIKYKKPPNLEGSIFSMFFWSV